MGGEWSAPPGSVEREENTHAFDRNNNLRRTEKNMKLLIWNRKIIIYNEREEINTVDTSANNVTINHIETGQVDDV